MNNAKVLAFASEDYGPTATSHLGTGTHTDVFVFDPTTQITQSTEAQNSVKRPKNSSSRSSSSLYVASSKSNEERAKLDSRLEAQRQFVYTEITQILTHNKPQALLIEILNMVQLLCLHSHSEESRLWEYAVGAITTNIETLIIPRIKDCLEKFQEFLILHNSVTGFPDENVVVTHDPQLDEGDTKRLNEDYWVKAAKFLHQIIQDMLESISILQSLLGSHPTSGKRNCNTFKNEALECLAQTLIILEVKDTLALIILENLVKQAIKYFIEHIDKLEERNDFASTLTQECESTNDDDFKKRPNQYLDDIKIPQASELSFANLNTLALLSIGTDSILMENIRCIRDFFDLIFEVGQFCKISESLKEIIDLTIISGVANIQRTIRKNKTTNAINTTKNIVQVYRFLNLIQLKDVEINSVLTTITWRHLLQDFSEDIEDSLPTLILPENWPILRAMTQILVCSDAELSISSSKILLHAWTKHVQNEALKKAETTEFINSLLQLKADFSNVVKYNFQDERFKSAISIGISKALSPRNISAKVIHQLSRFCDVAMRQSNKNSNDNAALSNALEVFKLLPDKDAFAQAYARDLSRRLLTSKNCNLMTERIFIDGMVAILGDTECTTRLTDMVENYSASKLQYQSLDFEFDFGTSVDFSAIILEKKIWPDIPNLKQELKIPSTLSQLLDAFQSRYASENEKKKLHNLDWSNYALHQLTINVNFESGSKELVLNLFQASVLMAFESQDCLLLEDLEKITGLTSQFLMKVLLSLCSSRYPILKLESNKVTFNSAFEEKQSRIRIPMIREKENALEETNSALSIGRSSQIQAAMVREIKAKRQVPYVVCLAAFLEKYTWASMSELKLAIERLITDGYIRRSDNDANLQYIP